MNKSFFFFKNFLGLLIIFSGYSITANAQCSGRYYDKIFSPTTPATVQYGSALNSSGSNQTLSMDIYQPAGDSAAKRPLLILAFGGAFLAGSRSSPDMVHLGKEFAERGFVTATIDYRLNPFIADSIDLSEAIFTGVQDAKAAIRYFYKDAVTANTYRVDTNQIYFGGTSSGAIIGTHLGYVTNTFNTPLWLNNVIASIGGLEGNSGNPGYSSGISGIINLCGAILDTSFIDSGEIPMVSMHGNQDAGVPYCSDIIYGSNTPVFDGSASMKLRTAQLGMKNPFYTWKGANHIPYLSGGIDSAYMDTTVQFVRDFLFDMITGNLCGQSLAVTGHAATVCGQTVPCAVISSPSILGNTSPNPLQTVTYSAPQQSGYTYSWNVTGGNITSAQGTNAVAIQWGAAGTYQLSLTWTDAFGCSSDTTIIITVTCSSLPPAPVITGSTNVEIDDTVVYTAPNQSGYSYDWDVSGGSLVSGQGTNNVSVYWHNPSGGFMPGWPPFGQGSLSLVWADANGCDSNSSIAVSVACKTLPTISGPVTATPNSTVLYSAEDNTDRAFNWLVTGGAISAGQGSDSISVFWGSAGTGTVSVQWSDIIGCVSDTSTIQVTIENPSGIWSPSDVKNELIVFPNPAQNELYLDIKKSTYITVLNILGHTVLQGLANTPNPRLDISSLSPGLYLVYDRQNNAFSKFMKE